MATVSAKLPDPLAKQLKKRARQMGKTPSEVVRLAVAEYLAPPAEVWGKRILDLPRLDPARRRKRPKDVDELTWTIDTAVDTTP